MKATGVNCWGKREVIGVSCRLSEAGSHRSPSLQQLQKRGLEGVQLIVSDDHSDYLPEELSFPVPWQRCQFHLSQNASDTPADPTNVPPSPLTFETSSMPRLEAKRGCFGPSSPRPQPGAGR